MLGLLLGAPEPAEHMKREVSTRMQGPVIGNYIKSEARREPSVRPAGGRLGRPWRRRAGRLAGRQAGDWPKAS